MVLLRKNIIKPISFSIFSFLHLVRISIIEIPGVSSIKILESESGPTIFASFVQSSSSDESEYFDD